MSHVSGSPALRTRTSLRVVPAPRHEPPYDDERRPEERSRGGTSPPGGAPPAVQGSLALSFTLPSGVPAVPEAPSLRPVDENEPDFGPQRTPSAALPDPRSWTTLLSQAVVEVLAGHRPVGQLVRWTTPTVYQQLSQLSVDPRGARPTRRQARAVVRSVHVCEPVDGIAEACAHVAERSRSWALVLRLEGVDHKWRCTVLDLV